MIIVKTFDPKKNKYVKVGYIVGTTFIRRAKKDHYVWKYKGYGLQKDVFPQIEGCKEIHTVTDNGVYKSKVEDWSDPNKAKTDDLGNGMQRFLPVAEMERFDADQDKLV